MAGSRHKPYAATSQLSRPGSGRDFDWPPRATQTLFLRQLRWLEVRESRTADNTLHSDPRPVGDRPVLARWSLCDHVA